MYHSVTINGKNSWTNYHMVPVDGIYLPPPPEQKITTIDLKAANSNIDASELLTGYPVFNNRYGDLQYYILEPWEYGSTSAIGSAYDVFTEIMNDIHGQTGTMFFEDDPNWEYKGRFTVSALDTKTLRRAVSIHYDVKPYKYKRTQTSKTLTGQGTDTWNYIDLTPSDLGVMPNNPSVTITGLSTGSTCQVQIMYKDSSGNYSASSRSITETIGTNVSNKTFADFLFYRYARLAFKGASGTTCVYKYYEGRF